MKILKTYKDKSKIDQVVDLLFSKGLAIFDSVENHKMTVINEGMFRIKSIEIFNVQKKMQTDFEGELDNEINILSSCENIDKAMYLCLQPRCEIPLHTDYEDTFYRIVTGVIIPKKTEVTVLNKVVNLKHKHSIGFQANDILHSAINYSDTASTMLVLCLSKNCFGVNELIEIKNEIL